MKLTNDYKCDAMKLAKIYIDGFQYSNYYEPARALISDYLYFKEHIKRTKTLTNFDFTIIPRHWGYKGIVGEEIFLQLVHEGHMCHTYEEQIVLGLLLIDLSQALLSKLEAQPENIETLADFILLHGIMKWFYNIALEDRIHNFIHCSLLVTKVINSISNYKKMLKERGES